MPQKPITSYFKPKNNGAEIVKPSKRKAEEKKSPRPMKRKAVQFNENFLDLPHKGKTLNVEYFHNSLIFSPFM